MKEGGGKGRRGASAPQRKHHGETVSIMVIYGRALLWAMLGTQPISSKDFGKILTVYHSFQDKRVNVRHSKSEWEGVHIELKRVATTA